MAVKSQTRKTKGNNCKKYGMAITNFVLGEEINVPEAELFEHLRQCEQCRDEARNWQDFNALLSTEQYHSRPEVIEKWNGFIRAITNYPEYFEPVKPGQKVILDDKKDIGISAGIIWNLLGKEGKVQVIQIPFKLGMPLEIAFGALGWLSREKKIWREKDRTGIYASLTQPERLIYKRQNGKRSNSCNT